MRERDERYANVKYEQHESENMHMTQHDSLQYLPRSRLFKVQCPCSIILGHAGKHTYTLLKNEWMNMGFN
jgi:hypothetical protein